MALLHDHRPDAYTPKLITVLREGYDLAHLRKDSLAGLTVAIVALPLAMALAIASGASPDKGLVTAVIAGFLISALGGSRVQVGGPTGAFVVVIFNIIAQHGYDGLLLATLMAGLMLVVAGYAGLGNMIRFIPQPVVIGFTAGIALIIASSQVKDFLGLAIDPVPADFVAKWQAYAQALGGIQWSALALGAGSLLVIALLKRKAPRLPAFLIAILAASFLAAILGLPVDTIGTRFPDLSVGIPAPSLPEITLSKIQAVMPSAFTIAFLAGVEALLSAVVADGMTGSRHRPNQELVGQGVANMASAIFGGLPATGAIARTATNIKAGATSPVAGMMHAVFLLAFMFLGASLMAFVPLPALAAILFVVAWGMSEQERFLRLLRVPGGDRTLLLLTFALTVLVDLTVAIGVGVTLASLIFMTRMSRSVEIAEGAGSDDDQPALPDEASQRQSLPPGVEVFRIDGPIFFGVADELLDTLRRIGPAPRAIILRMRHVPLLDATGAGVLDQMVERAAETETRIIFSAVQRQPMQMLARLSLGQSSARVLHRPDFASALELAASIAATSDDASERG